MIMQACEKWPKEGRSVRRQLVGWLRQGGRVVMEENIVLGGGLTWVLMDWRKAEGEGGGRVDLDLRMVRMSLKI